MRAVAFIELLILFRVTLGAALFQNSLLTPLAYAHFLRARYYQSVFTRSASAEVRKRIEVYVRRAGVPPVVGQVWDKFMMLVERWVGSALAPQQGQAEARAQ